MSATATVEEYHPEVVAFARRIAQRIATGDQPFFSDLQIRIRATAGGDKFGESRFIQFLLSEFAKPRQQSGAAAS